MSRRSTTECNKAIRQAWEREQQLVQEGKGTRDWTREQQEQILTYGKAYDEEGRAFEGQHMKSAAEYPEYQGNPDNIQFLTRDEHYDAHQGSWQNPTNWYYDPEAKEFHEFGEDELVPCEVIELSDPIVMDESSELTDEESHQECIDGSIDKATELHKDFIECSEKGTSIKTEEYQKCIGYMQEGRAQCQEELNGLKAEQREYISSHNMGFREVAADETCKEYRANIESCEQQIGQYNYHITELSTDLELSQQNGLAPAVQSQGSSLSSGLGESVSSGMNNDQSM